MHHSQRGARLLVLRVKADRQPGDNSERLPHTRCRRARADTPSQLLPLPLAGTSPLLGEREGRGCFWVPPLCKQAGLGTPGTERSAGERAPAARAARGNRPRLCASGKRVRNKRRRQACARLETAQLERHPRPLRPPCSGKSKGLELAGNCPLQSREPPVRRFCPVGALVTKTLSHCCGESACLSRAVFA